MTNTEIIELLNSNEGVNKAFEGLEYYDALRLATATSKVLHSGMGELTETVVDNVKNLLSDDRVAPSVRYWMLRSLLSDNTEGWKERCRTLLRRDRNNVERDRKILEDVIAKGFGTKYDSENDTFISYKNEIEGFRYSLIRGFPHEYDVEKLIAKMKEFTEEGISKKANGI